MGTTLNLALAALVTGVSPVKANIIAAFADADLRLNTIEMSSGFVTPGMFAMVGAGGDDAAAFQSAMNDPRPIYIPPGNYLIGSAIIYSGNNSKRIFGAGRHGTFVVMTNAAANGFVKLGYGSFIIEHMNITTNVAKTSGAAIVLGGSVLGGADAIDNCTISGAFATPLYDGIVVNTSVIPSTTRNYFLNCSNSAISLNNITLNGGGESRITNNIFNTALPAGNNASAITIRSGIGSVSVVANIFQNYDYMVNVQLGLGTTLTGLMIQGNSFEGGLRSQISIARTSTENIQGLVAIGNHHNCTSGGNVLQVSGAAPWVNNMIFSQNSVFFSSNYALNIAGGKNLSCICNTFEAFSGATVPILTAAAWPVKGLVTLNQFSTGSLVTTNGNAGVTVVNNY